MLERARQESSSRTPYRSRSGSPSGERTPGGRWWSRGQPDFSTIPWSPASQKSSFRQWERRPEAVAVSALRCRGAVRVRRGSDPAQTRNRPRRRLRSSSPSRSSRGGSGDRPREDFARMPPPPPAPWSGSNDPASCSSTFMLTRPVARATKLTLPDSRPVPMWIPVRASRGDSRANKGTGRKPAKMRGAKPRFRTSLGNRPRLRLRPHGAKGRGHLILAGSPEGTQTLARAGT